MNLCNTVSFFLASCGGNNKDHHTHILTMVLSTEPTCEKTGNSEYYTCDCGKYFSDAEAKTEIAKDSWVITAKGHTYSTTWVYNETHHWKEATCEHKDEKGEYAEHTIVDNKCFCGWTTATQTIELAGKTFNFVSTDTTHEKITYNSGNLVFKADGSIEVYLNQTINAGETSFQNNSTAVGTYVQNGNQITFSLTGVQAGGSYHEYPAEMAESFKNLKGVIEGNKVILGVPYQEDEMVLEHLTFELVQE